MQNIEKRCYEVSMIVNQISKNWSKNAPLFSINSIWKDNIKKFMITKLEEWSGVDIKACKNKISSWNGYWDRADNWFNRNKGQWFGDYLFYPLFESKLVQYSQRIANELSKKEKTNKLLKELIFMEILNRISNEHIRFKQTRSQSLLIDQSLVQSYKLRNLFLVISKMNQCEWKISNLKKSAKLYREAWRNCVGKMHYKLSLKYQESKLIIKQQPQTRFQQIQTTPLHITTPVTTTYPVQMRIIQSQPPPQTTYIPVLTNNASIIPIMVNVSPIQPNTNVLSINYKGISCQSIPNLSQTFRYKPY